MSKSRVPAADHTLRVLSLLANARGPLPASMIASRLELPRSTVYHLLATLQAHDFVMHLAEERRYGLGIAAVELSSAYTRQEPLARIGRPLLAALAHRVRASGHLAVPHGRDVLYVIEERAPGTPPLVTDVNVRLPMTLTASGRAILAALPKSQLRALFPNRAAFVQRVADETETEACGSAHPSEPDHPIDRYSTLRTVLDETRTRGYALEREAVTPGLWSVGHAVLDHRGWPVAAISVTFLSTQVNHERLTSMAAHVGDAAAALQARIHGQRAAAR